MTNALRLALVRAVHTVIYAVMATASLVVLAGGISGARGPWLWTALALVGAESAVFVGSGLKCPLTGLASAYGAAEGADTFLPVRFTRHTLALSGPMLAAGALLLAIRWVTGVWR